MNKTFREVAQHYKRTETLTHQQVVTRMYRKCLRMTKDIYFRREWYNVTEAIKAEFVANKDLDPTSGTCRRLIRETKEKLEANTHPDPYIVPYMPGGSSFMRYSPPPLEAVFPHGIPPEANIAPKDINYIQVPMSATPEGMETCVIDFYKKNSE